jgi:hypothetical protein
MSKLIIRDATVYATEDGQEFLDYEEAQAHQRELDIQAFWDKYGYSGMGACEAVDICVAHGAELRSALGEF